MLANYVHSYEKGYTGKIIKEYYLKKTALSSRTTLTIIF